MPICIECRYPVPQLYHVLHSSSHKPSYAVPNPKPKTPSTPSVPSSTATTPKRSSAGEAKSVGGGGGDVRLTQCPRCKRFADKYVEHDFVVLFIDLVLVKPQVYRHLLFNRLSTPTDTFSPSIIRLGTLLLLFDVYLTWSSIESLPSQLISHSPIPGLPILAQYAFYLFLCTSTTLAQHLTIRSLARTKPFHPNSQDISPTIASSTPYIAHYNNNGGSEGSEGNSSYYYRPNAISTAILVSSCMKLFPILMVVWKYDDVGGQVGRGVQWAVALQNMEALRILLGCDYMRAGALVALGQLTRWVVQRLVLGMAGLGNVGNGVVG